MDAPRSVLRPRFVVGPEYADGFAGCGGIWSDALGVPVVGFLNAHRLNPGDERADAFGPDDRLGGQECEAQSHAGGFVEGDGAAVLSCQVARGVSGASGGGQEHVDNACCLGGTTPHDEVGELRVGAVRFVDTQPVSTFGGVWQSSDLESAVLELSSV